MKHFVLAVVAGAAALSVSAPAQATVCASGVVSDSLVACSGYFAKNQLNNSSASVKIQNQALLTDLGLVGAPDYAALMAKDSLSKVDTLGANGTLSFPITDELFGETYIGIHWGGNQTAFYKFDFDEVVSSIQILAMNPGGFSGAVLYSTQVAPPPPPAVPEPATWALMIGGFALAGSMMRRRKMAVRFA